MAFTAAQSVEEMKYTIDTFKISIQQNRTGSIKSEMQQISEESMKYAEGWYEKDGRFYKVMGKDALKIPETEEFKLFYEKIQYLQNIDCGSNTGGHDRGYCNFIKEYKDQLEKVKLAKAKMAKTIKTNKYGASPNQEMQFDVNDDAWVELNTQIYELRNLQQKFLTNKDGINDNNAHLVELITLMRNVTVTPEWKAVVTDWKKVTGFAEHKMLV